MSVFLCVKQNINNFIKKYNNDTSLSTMISVFQYLPLFIQKIYL
jgi:hypothetical protein